MKKRAAVPRRGKVFQGFFTILGLLVIFLGAIIYLSTRAVEIEFTQDPNPLEAHEANRKIKLLEDARTGNRKGFIRLSEVEINSFLETRYNEPKNTRTNLPIVLVKTGVLLHETNLTFVSWHKVNLVSGFALPFVWQRTVSPRQANGGSAFEMDAMRLGRVNVPRTLWPKIAEVFGKTDDLFAERRTWLQEVPKVALMKNDLSLAPEVRLYTYDPVEAIPSEKAGE